MVFIDEKELQAVVQKNLMPFQLIHVAFAAGLSMLLIATLLMSQNGARLFPDLPSPLEMMPWLTFIHIFVAVGCAMLHAFMPAMVMASTPVQNAEQLYQRIVTMRVIQLALFELPAWVGMAVCLLGVRNGAMTAMPIYWLNLVTTVAFYIRIIRIFPTEEKLITLSHDLSR